MYRSLKPAKILETVVLLEKRITERFPEAGLGQVAGELRRLVEESATRTQAIRRPNVPLRGAVLLLVAAILGILGVFVANLRFGEFTGVVEFVNFLEPALGAAFFVGALILFLVTLEVRMKRGRALKATHELRVLAHIIDMHQLTKDPELVLQEGPSTPSSPKRTMTRFELSRYLDYCSEMLALISKAAALYAQSFDDTVALSAVDQVETLTTGLARKIWQKLMILDRFEGEASATVG